MEKREPQMKQDATGCWYWYDPDNVLDIDLEPDYKPTAKVEQKTRPTVRKHDPSS